MAVHAVAVDDDRLHLRKEESSLILDIKKQAIS